MKCFLQTTTKSTDLETGKTMQVELFSSTVPRESEIIVIGKEMQVRLEVLAVCWHLSGSVIVTLEDVVEPEHKIILSQEGWRPVK